MQVSDDDLELGGMFAYVQMMDEQHPDRICAWCCHPRNSAECQFAARHIPYREMFA